MFSFRSVIMFALLVLAAGCLPTYDSEAVIMKGTPQDWKVGYQHDFGIGKGYIREFIPSDESISAWQHLVTVQFLEGEQRSPREYMQLLETKRKEECKGTMWKVLAEDSASILYEW